MSDATAAPAAALTPEDLRAHWQGHRALTRRVIEAYPEDQLWSFSLGGMRPFGALVQELLAMGAPMARGTATGEWGEYSPGEQAGKAELLRRWDEASAEIDALWPRIPAERFHETITAFGQYTGPAYDLLMYVIDNEIHHRGQAYVYLRALGIEPPHFWERG
jgi:uncharacterized damage-inducible protein DinB